MQLLGEAWTAHRTLRPMPINSTSTKRKQDGAGNRSETEIQINRAHFTSTIEIALKKHSPNLKEQKLEK